MFRIARRLDGRSNPGAFADEGGEHSERAGHAGELGGEFVDGEGGFVGSGGEDLGLAGFESGSDGIEDRGAELGREFGEKAERGRGVFAGTAGTTGSLCVGAVLNRTSLANPM